ncbi:hypothetical protein SAMN05444503_111171 [Pseudomonas sp. BS3767]|uniref:hypothetical protein n=1 Tax=Pseudomonas TaxID=286 RepID=UPI00087E74C9|nr:MULTISPECIES: hypothetical protein [Pseudomonas]SDO53114.1 hypothetical protein SAMN05444502_113171 [Pseudomonas sp. BS3759]NAP06183.1 hypothetical protein [Pseudomonas syringae]NAP23161.1 hypothetical protein [Pseudomonas syringae]NAP49230.1 hypothetical protein [Pseudomonas syringae]NAP83215.1 hypothetical protein [Pseudomonas syringae]
MSNSTAYISLAFMILGTLASIYAACQIFFYFQEKSCPKKNEFSNSVLRHARSDMCLTPKDEHEILTGYYMKHMQRFRYGTMGAVVCVFLAFYLIM